MSCFAHRSINTLTLKEMDDDDDWVDMRIIKINRGQCERQRERGSEREM
jgi:hypothetical protein